MHNDLSKFINATEAGERLNISRVRVVQLIAEGRLPAFKAGRTWFVDPADLALVEGRKPGRPRTSDTEQSKPAVTNRGRKKGTKK